MDVCVACGKRRERGERGDGAQGASTAMRYIHEGLEMSSAELDRAKAEEKTRVLNSGKLLVVLDLDHTLLNSARFSELSQERTTRSGGHRRAPVRGRGGSPAETAPPRSSHRAGRRRPPFSCERKRRTGGEGDRKRREKTRIARDRSPRCSPCCELPARGTSRCSRSSAPRCGRSSPRRRGRAAVRVRWAVNTRRDGSDPRPAGRLTGPSRRRLHRLEGEGSGHRARRGERGVDRRRYRPRGRTSETRSAWTGTTPSQSAGGFGRKPRR